MKRVFTVIDHEKGLEIRKQHSFEKLISNPNRLYASGVLYRALLYSNRPEKCAICGIADWQNQKLTLEIDHIDGNRSNNHLENLRFLCPNCHSQTDNWRGRNINDGKKKVADEELLKSLHENKNIRQALIKVGLTPKGANYDRASRLLATEKAKE